MIFRRINGICYDNSNPYVEVRSWRISGGHLCTSLSGGEQTGWHSAVPFTASALPVTGIEPETIWMPPTLPVPVSNWRNHPAGALAISHERRLPDTMQRILGTHSVCSGKSYSGGNYTHYAEQKAFQLSALQSEEKQLQSQLNREKTELQRTLERKHSAAVRARKVRSSGSSSPCCWISEKRTKRRSSNQNNQPSLCRVMKLVWTASAGK